MRLTTEQHDTLAAIIGRREWGLAKTSMERAGLVLDDLARVGIDALDITPAQLSVAMPCMPLNAQDIGNWADMASALAAVRRANYDGAPYCSAGHRTKASCDCGPIAANE